MPKLLKPDQISMLRTDGYVAPIPVFSKKEATGFRRSLENFEQSMTDESREETMATLSKFKPHLLFTWLDKICHNETLLNAIEDLIGPDLHRPELLYRKNGVLNPPIEKGFYSTIGFTSEVIQGLKETAHTGKPFFAYLALTAPHWPMQLPEEHIADFAGRYDTGYDIIRRERIERQRELGFFDHDGSTAPRPPDVPAWDNLDEEGKKRSARVMEIYAGMIGLMDSELGRLLAYLESAELAENTVVIFLSDNGPDSWDEEHAPPAVRDHAAKFDNSLDNMGKQGSFTLFDRGWGWVSGTPFRGYKGSTFEGGIRVNAFVAGGALPLATAEGLTSELTHRGVDATTPIVYSGSAWAERRE